MTKWKTSIEPMNAEWKTSIKPMNATFKSSIISSNKSKGTNKLETNTGIQEKTDKVINDTLLQFNKLIADETIGFIQNNTEWNQEQTDESFDEKYLNILRQIKKINFALERLVFHNKEKSRAYRKLLREEEKLRNQAAKMFKEHKGI